jgi:hypothetical protein
MAKNQSSSAQKVVALRSKDPSTTAIRQLPLLPLRVDATIPSPLKSADLKELVQTIDGHIYAYKSLEDNENLPASEFLCYRMAAACRLPVPFSALIEKTPGGEIGFGSRFEGGIEDPARLSAHDQLNMFRDSKGPVSAILALDHFVGNDDRHKGNFIFRRNFNEKWVPLAIDYSRALYVRGFPDDESPLPEACNTRRTVGLLKSSDMWDGPFAVFALEYLAEVQKEHVAHWLEEMPLAWLNQTKRQALVEWWQSDQFSSRLQAVYSAI